MNVLLPEKSKPSREIPDKELNSEERKEKIALLYLDSISLIIAHRKEPILNKQLNNNISLDENKKPAIPKPNIHTPPFQRKNDTNRFRKKLIEFISLKESPKPVNKNSLPGKYIALEQTLNLFSKNPRYIGTGVGLGNFSSKTAFKATGLQIAGSYPESFIYMHPLFISNHLNIYTSFFSSHSKKHSIINSPNSVYDQLLSEYGVIGILSFFFLYIGFFLKNKKHLTYGIPLLLLLSGLFFIEYWFEQLSVIVMFELMLFLNIRERQQK